VLALFAPPEATVPIISHKYKLLYVPVPKNACTSIKNFFWNLEHEEPFVPFEIKGKKYRHIHDFYPTTYFSQANARALEPRVRNYFKFTVIREPIERLVSCYRNRILFHRELSLDALKQAKVRSTELLPTPDINHFIKHLKLYRVASKAIEHHTELQSKFIGTSLRFFDHVGRFEDINDLEAALSGVVGSTVAFERLQTGGPPADMIDMSEESREILYSHYEPDYLFLRGVYC